jgi:hypothetical protein
MTSASRLWGLLAAASRTALVAVFESLLFVLIAKVFAPVALGHVLFWTFLSEIPESRIGREVGYLVVYVIGVPGLNTSGRRGDDPYLILEDYYPPVVLSLVIVGLILGLGVIDLLAREQRDRGMGRRGRFRWGWRSVFAYAGFAIASIGLAIAAACLWELSWKHGLSR